MELQSLNSFTIGAIRQLAASYLGDLGHTNQVTFLSLRIFDGLKKLHHLGDNERLLLECGALLHDIGWAQGWKGHHKSSLQMIQDNQLLPLTSKEKLLIGSIARYHRKSLPSLEHDHYAALEPDEREVVSKLAAILRIADGLDRTHTNAVVDVSCITDREQVIMKCMISHTATEEETNAYKKADLFELVYKRKIIIQM